MKSYNLVHSNLIKEAIGLSRFAEILMWHSSGFRLLLGRLTLGVWGVDILGSGEAFLFRGLPNMQIPHFYKYEIECPNQSKKLIQLK